MLKIFLQTLITFDLIKILEFEMDSVSNIFFTELRGN